jgi:hypothetical protein
LYPGVSFEAIHFIDWDFLQHVTVQLRKVVMVEVILYFQDVDDLDAGLFGSSFSKKQDKPNSTKTTVKSALKVSVI